MLKEQFHVTWPHATSVFLDIYVAVKNEKLEEMCVLIYLF